MNIYEKISLLYTLCLSLLTSIFVGCSDWTDMEAKSFPEEVTSDEYYAALRAYKQSDHQVSFGWYGGWTGDGAYMKTLWLDFLIVWILFLYGTTVKI